MVAQWLPNGYGESNFSGAQVHTLRKRNKRGLANRRVQHEHAEARAGVVQLLAPWLGHKTLNLASPHPAARVALFIYLFIFYPPTDGEK